MDRMFDTIVAPITGAQTAAVAVIRLSGPDAWQIARRVFSPWPEPVQPRFALYGRFAHGDDGLALPFAHGHSYTGEETVELSVHGSTPSVAALLDACIAAGARLAEPGEFTYQAFRNGRLDLTRAEAVREIVESQTRSRLAASLWMKTGQLASTVGNLRDQVYALLAAVEASVDFSEEIGDFDRIGALRALEPIQASLAELIEAASVSQIVRDGVRISILGQPNAGKSSLLNRLAGSARAIVAASPGTTRDAIECPVDLNGLTALLVDTAGLRDTADPVEREGVDRSHHESRAAHLVWYLYDGSAGWTAFDGQTVERLETPALIIASKSDLPPADTQAEDPVRVSAVTGLGIDELVARTKALVGLRELEHAQLVLPRHREHLQRTWDQLVELRAALETDVPDDLLSVRLRAMIDELGAITGETASPDMVERIFRDFCIGK